MIVLDILGWIALVIGALLLVVLLVPLSLSAEGLIDDDEEIGWHARFAWGFGFLAVHLLPGRTELRLVGLTVRRFAHRERDDDEARAYERRRRAEARARRAEKRRARRERKDAAGKARPHRGLFWFLRSRRVLFAIARRYLGALHLRGGIEGVVGLPSPEHNVTAHQLITFLETRLPDGLIAVEVDWSEEVLSLRGRIGGWVWPLQLAGITLWVLIDRRTWRAIAAT